MSWLCLFPIMLIYGILVGWRTRWNSTAVTIVPALLMATFSAAMAWWSMSQTGGAVYCDTPWCSAGLMFFSVFGVWFLGIGSIVFLSRHIANRMRGS